jgi:hypothetical protein
LPFNIHTYNKTFEYNLFQPFRWAASDHSLMVAEFREKLLVNKWAMPKFDMERFNPKKLNDIEGKE